MSREEAVARWGDSRFGRGEAFRQIAYGYKQGLNAGMLRPYLVKRKDLLRSMLRAARRLMPAASLRERQRPYLPIYLQSRDAPEARWGDSRDRVFFGLSLRESVGVKKGGAKFSAETLIGPEFDAPHPKKRFPQTLKPLRGMDLEVKWKVGY
jgi:hypothetical protein